MDQLISSPPVLPDDNNWKSTPIEIIFMYIDTHDVCRRLPYINSIKDGRVADTMTAGLLFEYLDRYKATKEELHSIHNLNLRRPVTDIWTETGRAQVNKVQSKFSPKLEIWSEDDIKEYLSRARDALIARPRIYVCMNLQSVTDVSGESVARH